MGAERKGGERRIESACTELRLMPLCSSLYVAGAPSTRRRRRTLRPPSAASAAAGPLQPWPAHLAAIVEHSLVLPVSFDVRIALEDCPVSHAGQALPHLVFLGGIFVQGTWQIGTNQGIVPTPRNYQATPGAAWREKKEELRST